MRLAVDSAGEAADDDETRRSELSAEEPGHLSAVRGAGPRSNDSDRRAAQCRRRRAPNEQTGRWIVDRPQKRREARVGARKPAHAALTQASEIRAFVEDAGERPKSWITARLPHEVPVRLGRERGQREIAHAAPSSVGER
jgi:hypothetical protein